MWLSLIVTAADCHYYGFLYSLGRRKDLMFAFLCIMMVQNLYLSARISAWCPWRALSMLCAITPQTPEPLMSLYIIRHVSSGLIWGAHTRRLLESPIISEIPHVIHLTNYYTLSSRRGSHALICRHLESFDPPPSRIGGCTPLEQSII